MPCLSTTSYINSSRSASLHHPGEVWVMFVNTTTGVANSPDEPPDDCGSSGIYFSAHGLVVIFTFLYNGGWGIHAQIPFCGG